MNGEKWGERGPLHAVRCSILCSADVNHDQPYTSFPLAFTCFSLIRLAFERFNTFFFHPLFFFLQFFLYFLVYCGAHVRAVFLDFSVIRCVSLASRSSVRFPSLFCCLSLGLGLSLSRKSGGSWSQHSLRRSPARLSRSGGTEREGGSTHVSARARAHAPRSDPAIDRVALLLPTCSG